MQRAGVGAGGFFAEAECGEEAVAFTLLAAPAAQREQPAAEVGIGMEPAAAAGVKLGLARPRRERVQRVQRDAGVFAPQQACQVLREGTTAAGGAALFNRVFLFFFGFFDQAVLHQERHRVGSVSPSGTSDVACDSG